MASATFNTGYNTLTSALPAKRAKVCQCGAPLPAGTGIALTVADEPYQARRAPRMCVACAQEIIRARVGFRRLNKDYLHLMEDWDGPLTGAEAAEMFGLACAEVAP